MDGNPGGVRLIPERWRWANHLYAFLLGYFWAACPLCGRMSGGHEWRDIDGRPSQIPTADPTTFRGICPWCTREGKGQPLWTTPAGPQLLRRRRGADVGEEPAEEDGVLGGRFPLEGQP
jgi:hypothetical protein